MNEPRLVQAKVWDRVKKEFRVHQAYFHGFSIDYEPTEGNAMFPVAIVELEDGTVGIALAENITFLTPWGNSPATR